VQLLGDHTILALASFSGSFVPSNAASFKKRKYKEAIPGRHNTQLSTVGNLFYAFYL
jgi:hypothetical protein